MNQYQTRPVGIQAIQWTGENFKECCDFCPTILEQTYRANGVITIPTKKGHIGAKVGDYIIKRVNDEFYPCPSDVFNFVYEEVK